MDKSIKRPLVSVIIPVYNTEDYVEIAVRSILNQSITDLELILVDDGSTDKSLQILKSLADEDGRIILISQPNQGQSVARNRALQEAKGEYLYFMDSDDILKEEALEECLLMAQRASYDLIFFDAEIFTDMEGFDLGFDYRRLHKLEQRDYTGAESIDIMIDKGIFRVSPCLYIVKREYFNERGLKFYPGIIHEDELFTPLLFIDAKKVGFIDKQFFRRRLRPDSVMTKPFAKRNKIGYMTVLKGLKEEIDIREDKLKRSILIKLFKSIINALLYKLHTEPFGVRVDFFASVFFTYYRYINPRSVFILFFKKHLK